MKDIVKNHGLELCFIGHDTIARKPVNTQARKIMRPAYDHERYIPAGTIEKRPQPSSPSEVHRMMLEAERVGDERHAAALRRRKPRYKVSMRKRARNLLRANGIRDPSKAEIKAAMQAVKTGRWLV